jgi:hypothetical protein
MTIVLNFALVLSIISFVLSSAPYTPMVFVSGLTALIAIVGIWQGHTRRGLLTVYFAIGAFIVSPAMLRIEPVEWWLVALPAIGAAGSIVMYWTYRKSQKQSN